MKFNGATFNKAQQDQLKKKVGIELEAVVEKVNDIDARTTIKKYTVSKPTDSTQLQALFELLQNNMGRIIAIYALTQFGSRESLSFSINATESSSNLLLVGPTKIVGTNEIQLKQIEKVGNTITDKWVSLISESADKIVKIAVNGKTRYASIEVYYL